MSEELTQKPIGKLTIYGCGGAGVKIASLFEPMRGNSEVGICDVSVTYIDTAFSDLPSNVSPKNTFLLKDSDGSGGLRRELSDDIIASVPQILKIHEPGDISIVISSGSGGSGSVFAPSVVSELVRMGKQVIAVVIGDAHTTQWMNNTINTVKSYNGIAQLRKSTVPLAYFENTSDKEEKDVNMSVAQFVSGVAALWSRQNNGLDSKDLNHFLNPSKVTDFPPQLAMVKMFIKDIPEDKQNSVMTVVTLAKAREEARLGFVVDAQYVGIAPNGISANVSDMTPIHVVMLDQSFHEIMNELNDKLMDIKQKRAKRNSKGDIMGEVELSSNGLVI